MNQLRKGTAYGMRLESWANLMVPLHEIDSAERAVAMSLYGPFHLPDVFSPFTPGIQNRCTPDWLAHMRLRNRHT